MDLSILNRMIIDHLRYYGYQIAARLVESEIKNNQPKVHDQPSKLYDLVLKAYLGDALNEVKDNLITEINNHKASLKQGNLITEIGGNEQTSHKIISGKLSNMNNNNMSNHQKMYQEYLQNSVMTNSNNNNVISKQSPIDEIKQTLTTNPSYSSAPGQKFIPSQEKLGFDHKSHLSSISKLINQNVSNTPINNPYSPEEYNPNQGGKSINPRSNIGSLSPTTKNNGYNSINEKHSHSKPKIEEKIGKHTSTHSLGDQKVHDPQEYLAKIQKAGPNFDDNRSYSTPNRLIIPQNTSSKPSKTLHDSGIRSLREAIVKEAIPHNPNQQNLINKYRNNSHKNKLSKGNESSFNYGSTNYSTLDDFLSITIDKEKSFRVDNEYKTIDNNNNNHNNAGITLGPKYMETPVIPNNGIYNNGFTSKNDLHFNQPGSRSNKVSEVSTINQSSLESTYLKNIGPTIISNSSSKPLKSRPIKDNGLSMTPMSIKGIIDTSARSNLLNINIGKNLMNAIHIGSSNALKKENYLNIYQPQDKKNVDDSKLNKLNENNIKKPSFNDFTIEQPIQGFDNLKKNEADHSKEIDHKIQEIQITNPDIDHDKTTGEFCINLKTLKILLKTTKFNEDNLISFLHIYIKASNYKKNPSMLLDRDRFNDFIYSTINLKSCKFLEMCFEDALHNTTINPNLNMISFKDCIILLEWLNPELPFAFMKFLFKLMSQGDDHNVSLRNLKGILNDMKGGKLEEMVKILKDSMEYITQNGHPLDKMIKFENYMELVADYEPLKKYG